MVLCVVCCVVSPHPSPHLHLSTLLEGQKKSLCCLEYSARKTYWKPKKCHPKAYQKHSVNLHFCFYLSSTLYSQPKCFISCCTSNFLTHDAQHPQHCSGAIQITVLQHQNREFIVNFIGTYQYSWPTAHIFDADGGRKVWFVVWSQDWNDHLVSSTVEGKKNPVTLTWPTFLKA